MDERSYLEGHERTAVAENRAEGMKIERVNAIADTLLKEWEIYICGAVGRRVSKPIVERVDVRFKRDRVTDTEFITIVLEVLDALGSKAIDSHRRKSERISDLRLAAIVRDIKEHLSKLRLGPWGAPAVVQRLERAAREEGMSMLERGMLVQVMWKKIKEEYSL